MSWNQGNYIIKGEEVKVKGKVRRKVVTPTEFTKKEITVLCLLIPIHMKLSRHVFPIYSCVNQ
jgi:hypothetical protein